MVKKIGNLVINNALKEGHSSVRTQVSWGGQAAIVSHHHKVQENVVCVGEKYRKSTAGQGGWNTGYTISHLGQKS